MSDSYSRILWDGPSGTLELLLDSPDVTATFNGIALIAHPHPLLGGTAEHKVPTMMARTARDCGWLAVRPAFRGTGRSDGVHDGGIGEAVDLMDLCKWLKQRYPGLPLVLMGFSFGAYVQAQVSRALRLQGLSYDGMVLVGAAHGPVADGRHYDLGNVPVDTLVVHGDRDDRVSLSRILKWAQSQSLPVTVIPGADHFFGGRLALLANAVRDYVLLHAARSERVGTEL